MFKKFKIWISFKNTVYFINLVIKSDLFFGSVQRNYIGYVFEKEDAAVSKVLQNSK